MKTHQMSVNASARREIPAARKGRPVERRDAESLEEEEGRGEGPVGRPAHANDLLRPEEDLAGYRTAELVSTAEHQQRIFFLS